MATWTPLEIGGRSAGVLLEVRGADIVSMGVGARAARRETLARSGATEEPRAAQRSGLAGRGMSAGQAGRDELRRRPGTAPPG